MPSIYYHRNFKPQYFYHIFNRGAYKNIIFLEKSDYETFIEILSYYLKFPDARHYNYQNIVTKFKVPNFKYTIHCVAYCLMPNHFHLILKQLPNANIKTNISNLMRRLSITYAIYFKYKYKHSGSLFESKFKNVTVDSEEQLLYFSKYIHQNPQKLTKKLSSYSYSSYPAFINIVKLSEWLHPEYIFKLQPNYQKFVETQMKERETKQIKALVLDNI
ncbi:transposase [Patescibacteria group bacterium]|nr:transposase [Patescibacteria group bacterium]